jgi:predicted DNA-binding transcriptional regulator YafY
VAPEHLARGIKRSSALKIQRQLLLLRCLCREPLTSEALIAEVNQLMLDAYPNAAREAFRHDLRALRELFGCVIVYAAGVGYRLVSVGDLALLDLSIDEIAALRFLDSVYNASNNLPEYQQVRQLVARIVDLLPIDQRGALNEGEPTIQLAGPHTPYPHDVATLRALRRGMTLRREVRFRYQSSLRPEEEAHRIAPVNLFTRDSHVYLLAYCLEGPAGMEERVGGFVDYRVDYIVKGSVQVSPKVLPPTLPKRPIWTIRYELSPEVASKGRVAHWFANTQIQYRADGSALVTATVHNLWQTRQILLRYLDSCLVLDPPELVALMREAAQKLGQKYAV